MRLTKKETRVMAFLLLLLVITVGYALLSQQLDINGTSKIKKTTWSIIWDNVQVNSNSVSGTSVTQAAQITNTEKTLVEYSITLAEPGEFYEFTVDAKNEGTIDGMVNVVSNKVYESNGTTERTLPEYLTYTVTYSDGKAIEPKQLLKSGSTEKYKVRVEFKDVAADKLPSQNEMLKFKFEVEYVQADDTAEEIDRSLTGTRYRTLPFRSVSIGDNVSTGVTLFNTSAEALTAYTNSRTYLRHTIEKDIVKESYVCFIKSGNTYCLQGQQTKERVNGSVQCKSEYYDSEKNKCIGTYFESNKAIIKQAFGTSDCNGDSSYLQCCSGGTFCAKANEDGAIDVFDNYGHCQITNIGKSICGG